MQHNFDARRDGTRGAHLSRRTVVTGVAAGAAWAIPAVSQAAAAPALIPSKNCTYTTAAWVANTGTLTASGANGMTATAVLNGSTSATSSYTNMAVITLTNSALPAFSGSKWLQLATNKNNTAGETVTITLPASVYCVSFYIQDIDTQFNSLSSKYRDWVSVTGFTASAGVPSAATYLSFSGGTVQPINTAGIITPTTYEFDYLSSANGLALFKANGAINSIQLTYKNTSAGTGILNNNNQQVWISPIKYATSDCNCM